MTKMAERIIREANEVAAMGWNGVTVAAVRDSRGWKLARHTRFVSQRDYEEGGYGAMRPLRFKNYAAFAAWREKEIADHKAVRQAKRQQHRDAVSGNCTKAFQALHLTNREWRQAWGNEDRSRAYSQIEVRGRPVRKEQAG